MCGGFCSMFVTDVCGSAVGAVTASGVVCGVLPAAAFVCGAADAAVFDSGADVRSAASDTVVCIRSLSCDDAVVSGFVRLVSVDGCVSDAVSAVSVTVTVCVSCGGRGSIFCCLDHTPTPSPTIRSRQAAEMTARQMLL